MAVVGGALHRVWCPWYPTGGSVHNETSMNPHSHDGKVRLARRTGLSLFVMMLLRG